MEETRKDGGSVFPPSYGYDETQSGISLRDYFASRALAIAAEREPQHPGDAAWDVKVAKRAYALADAMLAQRHEDMP